MDILTSFLHLYNNPNNNKSIVTYVKRASPIGSDLILVFGDDGYGRGDADLRMVSSAWSGAVLRVDSLVYAANACARERGWLGSGLAMRRHAAAAAARVGATGGGLAGGGLVDIGLDGCPSIDLAPVGEKEGARGREKRRGHRVWWIPA